MSLVGNVSLERQNNYSSHKIAGNQSVLISLDLTQNIDLVVSLGITLLCIMTFAVAANSFLLYSYTRNRKSLQSSFNVYVVSLSFSSMCLAVSSNFSDSMHMIFRSWFFGRPLCTFLLYGSNLFNPLQIHLHLILTLNRLWAVTFPITFRNYHSVKFAVGTICILLLYIHGWFIPAYLQDAMFYREDNASYCFINQEAQPLWTFWSNNILYNLPSLIIIFSYPYIAFKVWRQRRITVGPTAELGQSFSTNVKSRNSVVSSKNQAGTVRSSRL